MDRSRWTTADALIVADPTLASFFLDRLTELAESLHSATVQRERVALTHALCGVFPDCLDLGLGAEARAIVAGYPGTQILAGGGLAA